MNGWIALIGLRYRLVWAHARSRQGRIVLLVVGYLAIAVAAVLFAVGGFGAAAASIRIGRAGTVAAVILAGLHLNAAFASVVLGIGVETVERLCDRVAITNTPGRLVWAGELSPLRTDQPLIMNGAEFRTLDALYLTATGQRGVHLDWV